MRGVIDIEFVLAIFVFLSVVTFVSFVIIGNIPLFHGIVAFENLQSRGYQVSEVLVFSEGFPPDWDDEDVEMLGLSSGDMYVLSSDKMSSLQTLCDSSYENVKSLLGQGVANDLIINITRTSGTQVVLCGPNVVSKVRPTFSISRTAVSDLGNELFVVVSLL